MKITDAWLCKTTIFLLPAIIFICCQNTLEKPLAGYAFKNEIAVIQPCNSADYTGDLTIDIYIKLNSYPTTWTSIISKFQSDHINEFNLRLRDENTGQWYYGPGDRAFVLSWHPKEVLPLNEWVRLTAIRDIRARVQKIKINGEVVAERRFDSAPRAMPSNSNIILMGSGNASLDGIISEVRIWDKVLNKKDLNSTAQPIRSPRRQKNLIGYWKFTETIENKKVLDYSRNNQSNEIISVN